MNLPVTAKIKANGHLFIGGCDMVKLAEKFGTPLFVMDEETVRKNCRDYFEGFKGYPDFLPVFASKALSVKGILKLVDSEGFGADVSTGGEIFTALKAGCDPKKMYFHGNNKLEEEIVLAIKSNIWCFVADNLDELKLLGRVSSRMNKKVNVMFRVNPGIEAHTHEFIRTGAVDSKFGISKKKTVEAVKMMKTMKSLCYIGLHSHIGSQIFDDKPYAAEADVLFRLARSIWKEAGLATKEINLGGGIGIPYTDRDPKKDIKTAARKIMLAVKACAKKYGVPLPKIIMEPGRSIVATAGITLYTAGTVKRIPGIRTYVVVDGGMADNPRYALYKSRYDALIANKAKARPAEVLTIAGRACESGDVLIKDIRFPKAERGDIIAVLCTGAYNYSMASNYNRACRPAMVLAGKGKAKLLVKRETYKDLVRNDL